MSTSTDATGTADRLVLTGDLTVQCAAEIRTAVLSGLDSDLSGHPQEIAIDVSGVVELDTAGLQLLLVLRREAAQRQRTILLHDPSPAVREVLELARLDLHLEAQPALPPTRITPDDAPDRKHGS